MEKFRPIFICAIGGLFFLYDTILRVLPSVVTNDLMATLDITSAGIGLLGALFFYSYSPMQIPGGLLLDRFGPRKMITFSLIICTLASLVFATTHHASLAMAARFFVGVGTAIGYIGPMLLVAQWLPHRYYTTFVGIIAFLGAAGGILGQNLLAFINATYGLSATLWIAVWIGAALTFLCWFGIRDRPFEQSDLPTWRRFFDVIKKPQSWWIGLVVLTIWAPTEVFGALWGISFLTKAYQLTTSAASALMIAVWIGVGLGGPLFGWWSQASKRRKLPLIASSCIGLFATSIILLTPTVHLIIPALFLLGAASSAQVVTFGLVLDIHSPKIAATGAGFNNMVVTMGNAILEMLVGLFLKAGWDGKTSQGVPVYSLHDFDKALLIMPLCFLISLAVTLIFVRETHCQHRNLS